LGRDLEWQTERPFGEACGKPVAAMMPIVATAKLVYICTFLLIGGTMPLWSWIRTHVGGKAEPPSPSVDSGRPAETGGNPKPDSTDQRTEPKASETFVGRIADDDPGYLETGAEKRAESDGAS